MRVRTFLSNFTRRSTDAGAYGRPIDLGELAVATRQGTRAHVHEVMPGLWLVASLPATEMAIGAGAGLWDGVATAASGVVTKLGDWVAGWFPKAQEARARGAAAADDVAREQFLRDDHASRIIARRDARDTSQALEIEQQRLELQQQQMELNARIVSAQSDDEADLSESVAKLLAAILAAQGGATASAPMTPTSVATPEVSGRKRRQQAIPGQSLRVYRIAGEQGDGCKCGGTCGGC